MERSSEDGIGSLIDGHEIRTPMNVAALLQVINDILDLSKVEAGRLQLEEVAFERERSSPAA